MYRQICIPLLFLIPAVLCAQEDNEVPWQFRKDEKGIRIYSRSFPDSSIYEVKAFTAFNASVSSIVSVLMDVEACASWVYSCARSKELKSIASNEKIYYSLNDIPWPASDRDMTLRIKTFRDKSTGTITCISVAEEGILPETDGVVRMNNIRIVWKLIKKDDNLTEIQYYTRGDPAGTIPDWIVNLFFISGPYESLINLREKVKEDKYRNARPDYISE